MSSSTADDKGPRITTVSVVMLVLATTAVALRFWGRYIAHKAGYWWDDWLALASLVCQSSLQISANITLISLALAFCLGELRCDDLLGINRPGKTL